MKVYYILHRGVWSTVPIPGQILHSGPTVVPILPRRGRGQQSTQLYYQWEYYCCHQQGIMLSQTTV
jgi:hypothetical protein